MNSDKVKNALESMLEKMKAGDFDEQFERFAQEEKDREKANRAFYDSLEFNTIADKLISSGIEHLSIEDILYFPEKSPINENEFNQLWDSIWLVHQDNIVEDEHACFETYYLEWRGYKLRMMHGQGTDVSFIKIKEGL